jgi:hypothetical protein
MICDCEDAPEVEKKLIKAFREHYKLIGGNEYFEVKNELEMINRFNQIIMNHKNNKHENLDKQSNWMQKYAFNHSRKKIH